MNDRGLEYCPEPHLQCCLQNLVGEDEHRVVRLFHRWRSELQQQFLRLQEHHVVWCAQTVISDLRE